MYFIGFIFSIFIQLGFCVENHVQENAVIVQTKQIISDIFRSSHSRWNIGEQNNWKAGYDFFWHVAKCGQHEVTEDLELFKKGKYWDYKQNIYLKNNQNSIFCARNFLDASDSLSFYKLIPNYDILMEDFSRNKIPPELVITPGIWAYSQKSYTFFVSFRGTYGKSSDEKWNNFFCYKHQLNATKKLLKDYPIKNLFSIDINRIHSGFLAFFDASIEPLVDAIIWSLDQDAIKYGICDDHKKTIKMINSFITYVYLRKWRILGNSRGGAVAIITQLFFPYLIVKAVHQWFNKKGLIQENFLKEKMIHALIHSFEENTFVTTYAAPKVFLDSFIYPQKISSDYIKYAKTHILHIYSPEDIVPKFIIPGFISHINPGIHILDVADFERSDVKKSDDFFKFLKQSHFMGMDYLKGLVVEKIFNHSSQLENELNILDDDSIIELSLK